MPNELLRFDFALGSDVDGAQVDLRMEVLREALSTDRRWTDVRVQHVVSGDPELCYVLVWARRTGSDPVPELQTDVVKTVATILPTARLSYGSGA